MTWSGTHGTAWSGTRAGRRAEHCLAGRQNALDSLLPPLLFVIVNLVWGLDAAAVTALAAGGLIALLRLIKRQSLLYALGGIGGVIIAVIIAKSLGRAEGYFVPGLVTGGLTVATCVISVLIGRPMVALTSRVARGDSHRY